ncbi:MAG: tetratricopeptide repeat protein [Hydrogenophaga sp.]
MGVLLAFGLRRAALSVTATRLSVNPGDSHALATRAHLLGQDGAFAEAIVLQQRLVQRRPADAVAWFNLGYLQERLGQWIPAERAFRRAADLAPHLDRAWYGLGLCLVGQSRLAEAIEPLQRSTQLQPMNPSGWYQLARVQADRGETEQVRSIIAHLYGFEPRVAAHLARETGLEPGVCSGSAG